MSNNKNLVLDVEENPSRIRDWLLFSIQHILAMLVACITVPLLTGLPIAATLISAGIGTIFYILVTKQKSPVFLSSSFAYLAPMSSALAVGLIGGAGGMNYMALILGMIMVGLVYVIIALVIKFVGTGWLNKVLPPIVVGPVIMVIGLGLAGSAISSLTTATGLSNSTGGAQGGYSLVAIFCGFVALIATALSSHYGKGKMISLIPFVIGMVSGYVVASLFTLIGYNLCKNEAFYIVDFSPLTNLFGSNFSFASIINYNLFVPNHEESFIFLRFDQISKFDWKTIGEVMLLFIPVSLVTVCEHIGDHENLGNILGRDLLCDEPGMKRTLLGDGIATAISGALCGAANTTYGENVAVVGTTRIASVKVVLLAAVMTIGIGFITPISGLLSTIPSCVTGGVSLLLYGFIAASGVKILIAEKVDFSLPKNIFVASVILVSGIGGLAIKFGNPADPVLQITKTAVAMLLGILLNVILVEKKETTTPVTEEVSAKKETTAEEASVEETAE